MTLTKTEVVSQFNDIATKIKDVATLSDFFALLSHAEDLTKIYAPSASKMLERLKQLRETVLKPTLTTSKQVSSTEKWQLQNKKPIALGLLNEISEHINKNGIETPPKQTWKDKFLEKIDAKILLGLLIPTFTLWMITLFAFFNAVNTGYSTEYLKGKNAGKDESQIQINKLTRENEALTDSIATLNKKIRQEQTK